MQGLRLDLWLRVVPTCETAHASNHEVGQGGLDRSSSPNIFFFNIVTELSTRSGCDGHLGFFRLVMKMGSSTPKCVEPETGVARRREVAVVVERRTHRLSPARPCADTSTALMNNLPRASGSAQLENVASTASSTTTAKLKTDLSLLMCMRSGRGHGALLAPKERASALGVWCGMMKIHTLSVL